ncbi:hypothetical protein RI367_003424 [Sorochytrium milnesiophthora]
MLAVIGGTVGAVLLGALVLYFYARYKTKMARKAATAMMVPPVTHGDPGSIKSVAVPADTMPGERASEATLADADHATAVYTAAAQRVVMSYAPPAQADLGQDLGDGRSSNAFPRALSTTPLNGQYSVRAARQNAERSSIQPTTSAMTPFQQAASPHLQQAASPSVATSSTPSKTPADQQYATLYLPSKAETDDLDIGVSQTSHINFR